MRTLPAIAPTAPQVDDDQMVPEELVGRLYRLGESAVLDLLAGLSPTERANLAMFCYRKAHLHRTGLAIAATCDRDTLIQAWGTALGQAIFAQSRERAAEPDRVTVSRRSRITLARSAQLIPFAPAIVPNDVDDADEMDEIDAMVDVATLTDLADPADAAMATTIMSAVDPL
jgi:hypothetical protein